MPASEKIVPRQFVEDFETVAGKLCTKCGLHKPFGRFGVRARSKDGLQAWCKECSSANAKEWYGENRESTKTRYKEYRKANKDAVLERTAKWQRENREKRKVTEQKWRSANAEKVRAQSAKYRKNNMDKHRERTAQWRKLNPEKNRAQVYEWRLRNPSAVRMQSANRRASIRNAGGRLSNDLAEKLLKLQKRKCACCGKPLGNDYHIDHIMPLALGGTNTDDNIQLLRAECNLQKHAKHPVDFMQQRGFLL